jgi:hypothetical protein
VVSAAAGSKLNTVGTRISPDQLRLLDGESLDSPQPPRARRSKLRALEATARSFLLSNEVPPPLPAP